MNLLKKFIFILFLCLLTLECNGLSFANTLEENEIPKIKIERRLVSETIPMNLEEITHASNRIFSGNCTKAEEFDDSESRLPVVRYTFKVIEGLKGVGNKKEITFKQWKPSVRDISFDKGKKYIMFLYPDSERGLTSPVGLLQGHFQVDNKGFIRKKEFVRNKINNRGLGKNLKTRKAVNIANNKFLNDYLHHCSDYGTPMRYKEFIQSVRYLVENE